MRNLFTLIVFSVFSCCSCCASPDSGTFPPAQSNWQGCIAMIGDLFGCTLADGHHTLWFGVNEPLINGGPKVLSDCGGSWREVSLQEAPERCPVQARH